MCTPRYGKGSSGLRTVRNCAAWPCTKTLLASWWCAKSATDVLPRRVLFHRYGRLFALNDEVSPICVLGNFHGLKPGVWVGARETDKVVRKSPAASAVFGFVVGWASISMAVHVFSVACMEPTKQRLHVDKEQEWRECVSLNGSSFNWDVSRAARGQPDSSVCLIVQVFHYIYSVCWKFQIKHNDE